MRQPPPRQHAEGHRRCAEAQGGQERQRHRRELRSDRRRRLRGPQPRKVAVTGDAEGATTFLETPSGRRLPGRVGQTARDGGKRGAWGLAAPSPSVIDSMLMLAPGVARASAMALITADLFAVLLGQRDIEHQDEHVDTSPLSPRPMDARSRPADSSIGTSAQAQGHTRRIQRTSRLAACLSTSLGL